MTPNPNTIPKWLQEYSEDNEIEPLVMDGFNDCIVGICHRFGQVPIIAYDKKLVIRKLMIRDEMSEEEAEEFFNFNQIGGWFGEYTPCFIEVVDVTAS